jgi:hypothetical protein
VELYLYSPIHLHDTDRDSVTLYFITLFVTDYVFDGRLVSLAQSASATAVRLSKQCSSRHQLAARWDQRVMPSVTVRKGQSIRGTEKNA